MDLRLAAKLNSAAEHVRPPFNLREVLRRITAEGLAGPDDPRWSRLPLPQRALDAFASEPASHKGAVRALGFDDPGYPGALWDLLTPPPALFVRGDSPLPSLGRCVALVGARRCTDEGRWVTRDLARQLSEAGAVVVSGLALGIDASAHQGALDVGAPTLAVLASPVDEATPRRHRQLADEILLDGGWLVSERPPGSSLAPRDFPRRNRLIAALTRLLVVVEAGERSGTLGTVRWAQELGREVGAVPGPITSPACRTTNRLLRDGAQIITSAEDILCLLGQGGVWRPPVVEQELHDDQRALLGSMPAGQGSARLWIERSGLPEGRAMIALQGLVARGLLRPLPGGAFGRPLHQRTE